MDHITSDSNESISAAATAIACIFGIVGFVQLAKSFIEKPAHHNSCSDPNCIRCHSNLSHHVDAFRRNVTLLRRLVKLEPEMFEGMRDDIWTVVEEMERSYVTTENGNLGILDYVKRLPSRPKKNTSGSIQHAVLKDQISLVPLSPQAGQTPTVFLLPTLEAIPFHHPDECHNSCPCLRLWKRQPIDPKSPPIHTSGDIEMLKKNFHIIRSELANLLASNENQFSPFDSAVYTTTNTDNKQTPGWSSIYLYHQGLKQSACRDFFPQTTNIIETCCPNRMAGKCGLGSIYFSKLDSNTKVNAHCGPTNVRWRCHLPLVVPKNCSDSRLCVGIGANEERVGWEVGVPILFDDSFLHSAVHVGIISDCDRNRQDGSRIVLIIDFWHPSLTEADRNAIGVLYPPGS
jgi:aspartyl/asparaginyl beta-hydroxylase (cupin superfamily)